MNEQALTGSTPFPHLLSPTRIGTMRLRNRVMLPPHAHAMSSLWGTQEEADRHIAYWESRVNGGAAWVDGVHGHIRNTLPPGFEPSGVGAETAGVFRLPFFVDRLQRLCDTVHAAGATVSAQLIHIGGMPHAPSPVPSAPVSNSVPHVLARDEIAWFREEFRFSAQQAMRGGLDGLELHANHDDILEWFLSPHTNRREDAYGGSPENRARFVVEIMREIRDVIGTGMTLGVRMNMSEDVPGGYDVDGGIEIVRILEATGLLDYVHLVMGSPWGNPSYIESLHFAPAQWAELAGRFRRSVDLPIAYTGLVNTPAVAERVLAAGHADVVGMGRAHLADAELVTKATENRTDDIRPCIGVNECISRKLVERISFGCAVNPHVGHDGDAAPGRAAASKRIVVVGGGPAGMELAALTAERGHDVELWERAERLGGQLRIAAAAPRHERFLDYLAWQERRLRQLGVKVALNRTGGAEALRETDADVVAIATGATPRIPDIPGADKEFVHEIREVLLGRVRPGQRVVVVAQDDHMPPLSLADHLAERGHEVTVVYGTAGPAQLVSRYTLGSMLGRLDARNVTLRCNEEVVAVAEGEIVTRNVYSGVRRPITAFDSLVFACGGIADDALFAELVGRLPNVHVLGDAYAPRRIVSATRQAYHLAAAIDTPQAKRVGAQVPSVT